VKKVRRERVTRIERKPWCEREEVNGNEKNTANK